MAALAAASIRQLSWGLRTVASEVSRYTRLASAIPDKPIRQDALAALTAKRPHLDGAAMFSTLPRRRNVRLVRALVSYELVLELLDNMNERAAHSGVRNGLQLHLALPQALNPHGCLSDYYRYHPWSDDNGYLARLVHECRTACVSLPRYSTVRCAAIDEARLARVLALNHHPDPQERDKLLNAWAKVEFPEATQSSWWELAGAATASLSVHALLALAGECHATTRDIEPTLRAHRTLSLIATLLDSYVDEPFDTTYSQHSYIGHYPPDILTPRLSELIRDGLLGVQGLRRRHRHTVVASSMIALYLSSDQAQRPERKETTTALLDAAGSLTRLLVPALRAWRCAYGLRSA